MASGVLRHLLLLSVFALGSCSPLATIARWNAELQAKDECIRRLCRESGGIIRRNTLVTGHQIYWCCTSLNPEKCEEANEDCEVTL